MGSGYYIFKPDISHLGRDTVADDSLVVNLIHTVFILPSLFGEGLKDRGAVGAGGNIPAHDFARRGASDRSLE